MDTDKSEMLAIGMILNYDKNKMFMVDDSGLKNFFVQSFRIGFQFTTELRLEMIINYYLECTTL